MNTPTIIELQNAIDRLVATAEAAAQKRAEFERRRLNLPSPNRTRWRRTDQAWLDRYLTFARSDELAKRQPQIDWLTRKVERLNATVTAVFQILCLIRINRETPYSLRHAADQSPSPRELSRGAEELGFVAEAGLRMPVLRCRSARHHVAL